jgi:hypothetical protein
LFKQVIKQKPNGGQVLPLGSDTACVALQPEAKVERGSLELQLILRAKAEE